MNELISIMVSGISIGTIFGFLLQKGSVGDFDTIVGQFLFKNFTVLKVMLTAIVVGGITIYSLIFGEFITALPAKNSSIIGSALGGIIFGIGMATLGYCPGTALAALGRGALDAAWGILGMFVGVIIFEKIYPFLALHILADTAPQSTLVQLLGISPWIIFIGLLLFTVILNIILKRYRL